MINASVFGTIHGKYTAKSRNHPRLLLVLRLSILQYTEDDTEPLFRKAES